MVVTRRVKNHTDQTSVSLSPSQLLERSLSSGNIPPKGLHASILQPLSAKGDGWKFQRIHEDLELNVCDGRGGSLQDHVVDITQELVFTGRGDVLQAAEAGLELLLLPLELQVGVREGVEDGRGWEGHDEDPTQDAAEGHHLARHAARDHVSVAHGRHGDDGPPIGGRDAGELQDPAGLILGHVDQRGEEGDGHAEEEEEQAELARAAAHGEAQRLQPQRVARQAHHVEDAQRPQHAQRQPHLLQESSLLMTEHEKSWSRRMPGCRERAEETDERQCAVQCSERASRTHQEAWPAHRYYHLSLSSPVNHTLNETHILALPTAGYQRQIQSSPQSRDGDMEAWRSSRTQSRNHLCLRPILTVTASDEPSRKDVRAARPLGKRVLLQAFGCKELS
nr:uncharacterized protein LOC106782977 [Equus caballus]